MSVDGPGAFRFGDFELDPAAYELRRAGVRVRLPRQPLDLLLLLVGRAGELVPRDDIARCLWPEGVYVDVDAGIHTAVLKIRRALGSNGARTPWVESVAGKGYRFAGGVTRVPVRGLHKLPEDLTSFIGRRKELDELPRLLVTSRLLCLTGSGGVGKTRVAVRLASELVSRFPDGVWLADLGGLTSPDLLAQTVADVVGVRATPPRSERDALVDFLSDRTALLVLDTCEHVIAACAALVDELLRAAASLRIVATSREALALPGEVVYRLPSLSLPDESAPLAEVLASEAGCLFIERAAAVDPSFVPSAEHARSVARICRRLDGIPLAIELAAARMAMLAPDQIEARLEDRFRLLTAGARTAVPRQRALEATVEWSYQLLSDHERVLLNRLSVFPASWTLEAAEAICCVAPLPAGETLSLLSRLVDKSMVSIDRQALDAYRYHLLDTVRDYARARAQAEGTAGEMRQRHFDAFYERFRDSQRIMRGSEQLPRLRQLRVEQDNVRAALEWGLASPARAEASVELAGALFWYWTKCGLFEEGKRWLRRAVAVGASPRIQATALVGLAHMYHFQGEQAPVVDLGVRTVSLGREHGDAWATSVGWFLQALASFELGQLDQARAAALSALEAADVYGQIVERGGPLMVLANVALARGAQDEALRLFDESIDVHRRGGDAWGLSILLSVAAGLRMVRDDFARARAQATEALTLCRALDDPRGTAWSLEVFAGLLAAAGRLDDAARTWGLSDALVGTSGGALTATIGWIRDRHIERVRHALGDPAFDRARRDGSRMSIDAVMALVEAAPAT